MGSIINTGQKFCRIKISPMRAEGVYGSMHTTFSTYGIHYTVEPLTIGTKDFSHYRRMATNQGFYKYYFNAVGTKVSGH